MECPFSNSGADDRSWDGTLSNPGNLQQGHPKNCWVVSGCLKTYFVDHPTPFCLPLFKIDISLALLKYADPVGPHQLEPNALMQEQKPLSQRLCVLSPGDVAPCYSKCFSENCQRQRKRPVSCCYHRQWVWDPYLCCWRKGDTSINKPKPSLLEDCMQRCRG